MSTATSTTPSLRPFIITRLLNAPRDLVWKCWTEREHMQWWGPKGVTVHHAKMDLRTGGIFHYAMRTPDGRDMWGKWVIREIAKPGRLVFVNSFSDENCGITRHPMNPDWPREILSTITFKEQEGKTLLTIEWLPLNPDEKERKTFDENHESMRGGWGGSLDQLEAYLASSPLNPNQNMNAESNNAVGKIETYIFLDGRCEEALEFYKRALGAKVEMMMRFKESPDKSMLQPGSENKIMHASVQIGATRMMMSDGRCTGKSNFEGFSLSIATSTEAEAEKVFSALAEGGKVQMPLTKTFFSARFGMVADKFGVPWMVLVAHP